MTAGPPDRPNADRAGDIGPGVRVRFLPSDDILPPLAKLPECAAECADGLDEPEPAEPESKRREAGEEPADRLELGLMCERMECRDPRSDTVGSWGCTN